MILSFSGDAFLVRRAARRAVAEAGFAPDNVTELGEGMDAEQVRMGAAQGGLFGRAALLLDFDAAFTGQAGVKPRNDTMKALEHVPDDALVVVIDTSATPARQKTYRALGEHKHVPTPRFGELARWIRAELEDQGVRFAGDVPGVLADLFGEDLPAIAAEVAKLSVLDESLSAERVRAIANRPAARSAFDMLESVVAGDVAGALGTCRSLIEQGEAPARVMGAVAWQFDVVARCVGERERAPRLGPGDAARLLKVSPYVARKALDIAAGLDERSLHRALGALLDADVEIKSGRDPELTLELFVIEIAGLFAARDARRADGTMTGSRRRG